MGDRFNRRAFLYLLPILLTISLGVALALDLHLIVGVGASLTIGLAISALIASYRYFADLVVTMYRSVARPIAKHAVRSSLKQAMTPLTCTGILGRNGTVHLKVGLDESDVIGEDDLLYVYEEADDTLWGVVRVVEHVPDSHLICAPTNRVSPQFWGHLEDRVGFDTSAPGNIYLIRAMPLDYQRVVENFLDDWR